MWRSTMLCWMAPTRPCSIRRRTGCTCSGRCCSSSLVTNVTLDSLKGITGLKGALRYVRAYRDQIFVIKLGGEVVSEPKILDGVAGQLALLSSLGIRVVVVHGGGPQASALSRRLGMQPRMVAGRRVTDGGALEGAQMVYAGALNV